MSLSETRRRALARAQHMHGTRKLDLPLLGRGKSRTVYISPDPERVIKINRPGLGFQQNRREWELWTDYPELRTWLAPCISISESGEELIQIRTEPLTPGLECPELIPALFLDTKQANWGLLYGNLVLHDYGSYDLSLGLTPIRRRLTWRCDS